ncbi:glycoside hydrolase family 130 protein [Alicyclobacillus sp.]|uniref:glycoside hydrolase family 130 protein n=1 Tax=Alicyclobacillus sp. TaxID=61169 RepID=UPI0025C06FDF|nr:glycoside hydrolase family 130 protein [Alicyclobacillus sp.]MCL6516062.1 glycoside hydrolase family 130 protein [Alicyclobacillus sp.]
MTKQHDVRFPLGPFVRYEQNPILSPQGDSWEAKDLFNPTAVVRGDEIYLFYRAEDHAGAGAWNGTSRIGLAISRDGVHFERLPRPVIEPTEPYELPGGCEDPRVVEVEGRYYLTYTAYDGSTARLCLATSEDLIHWHKHGPVFQDGPHARWSKSGAIVPGRIGGRLVMYFGDTDIWVAFSEDGIHWEAEPEPVIRRNPDPRAFDSLLVEPGPTPVLTDEGILLIYNGARRIVHGPDAGKPYYAVGQALFSLEDPARLIRRTHTPVMIPETKEELRGQVDFVVFAEGLVHFQGTWFLYYGMADSHIGVARCTPTRAAEPQDEVEPEDEEIAV